jgi:mono/diheme cytochrome c family protein
LRAERRALAALLVLALPLLAGGCRVRTAMFDQEKYEAYEKSALFADEAAMRPFPPGTVARGQFDEDEAYLTGTLPGGVLAPSIPGRVTVDGALLRRGEERYGIFCAPCHGPTGDGNGMIVQRGYVRPPSYHLARLRQAPDGHFFDAITRGFGRMPSYASQVPVEDRWAIVAYVRALQLSQNANLAALPSEVQEVARRALAEDAAEPAAGAVPEAVEPTRELVPDTQAPEPAAPMDENYGAPAEEEGPLEDSAAEPNEDGD